MHKLLFLTLFIFGQVLAQNRKPLVHDILEQLITEDITEPTMIENLTDQSKTQSLGEVKQVDRKGQQSNIDLNWQSLLKDLNGEPIAQDMAGRRLYKDEAPQPEVKNDTEHTMHKDVPSVQNVTEQQPTQDVASQTLVKNTTETPLGPNITQQPQDLNKPAPSQAQSVSMQRNTIKEQYQNGTDSAGSFGPTPDHNYHSPYLDPYKDSNYKSSMPPIQTQEQWNATNWHEEEGMTDDEKRRADEFREQEKRHRKMQEEINNTTTSCEEFLNNTIFDSNKLLNKDWHTIFYWNVRDEDPYNMKFSRPTETMIKRFKDDLHAEIRPPVDWSAAELFVETNVEYSALYVKTNVSGLYRAIPSAAFQYFGIPILDYALKIVNDEHLGIVNCKAKQCYALCDMEKLPQIEQIPKIAKSLGFHCLVNSSFVHVVPLDEKDPDDLDESLEDNFLGDYDTLNSDPLQIDIF